MGALAMMMAQGVVSGGGGLPTVTWNPSDKGSNITLTNGDRTAAQTVSGSFHSVRATHGKTTGKHYFEVRHDQANTAPYSLIGVCTSAHSMSSGSLADDANGFAYYEQTGEKFTNGAGSSYGASYTAGDVVGVALDMTSGKIWFAKNGVWQNSGNPAAGTGEAFSGLAGTMFAALSIYSGNPRTTMTGRFKAADFTYSPPAGFSAYGG